MSAAAPRLDERLPPDVVIGGSLPWSRYRQYPVFGLRWLVGRTLLFGGVIGIVAAVSGFAIGFAARDYATGAMVALHTFLAFTAMATAGPALATFVRHRRWPLRRERIGVVLAVLLGLVASYFADAWSSAYIEQRVEAALPSAASAEARVRIGPGPAHPAPDVKAVRERLQSAPPAERAAALTVNIIVLIVVYGLFGGGLALRAYFDEHRRREERELERLREVQRTSELRLGVLQAQVEPHFLFNTLAAVRALLRDRPGQAEATLDALVDYLRASIPRLRSDATALDSTLGDQLDLCARYLDVMRLRSGGRLDYTVDVTPALRALPFPPLLLITLVENAVKHGLEPRPGPGHVTLRAACVHGVLGVEVLDDGVGLAPGVRGGGLGLANVRGQLAARYGEAATLMLASRPDGGTLARLELPVECP